MITNIQKYASVIERLQDGLSPDVFTDDDRIRPELRRQILKTIKEIEPETDKVKGVFMLGSLTGYKYTPTSDIDIMIAVEGLKPDRAKTHAVKQFNGKMAVGTRRTISYFLATWRPDTKSNLSEIQFGVYDVLEDQWLNKPPERSEMPPTYAKFWAEFILADAKARHFQYTLDGYKKAKLELARMLNNRDRESLFEYQQIERQKKKTNDLFKKALDFVTRVDKDRKIAYSSGWGPGRNSKQNIVYKVLQYEENGEFFKDLVEYKAKENLKKPDIHDRRRS